MPTLDMTICNTTGNFVVTGMDYIDTENIAVSVLRSKPKHLNVTTLRALKANDGITHTVTYFVNTVTMQIREGVAWQSEVSRHFR